MADSSSTGGGALSFLSSGVTPGQSQQESESSSQLPSWYENYTQQILNKASQFANQPYQAYQGPRIAGQDSLTTGAYGEAAPLNTQATAGTQAAQNLVTQNLSQNNPLGNAQPYLNQGAGDINASVGSGQGGLAAAQGYLSSASNPTYNTVQSYMNPYNQNVTDAIAQAGATNFNNNIMPALQSSFIGAGNITGGNTEEANLANQAALNEQQAVSQAQSQALQSGYSNSQAAATADANRQATLAGTAGQLGTQQQTAQQNAGTDLINAGVSAGNLNSQGVNTGIAGAGALSNINTQGLANQTSAINTQNALGQQNQGYTQANENLAYQDFQNQLNYPITQAGVMQSALSGIQIPTSTVNYGASTGTPATIGNSPIQSITGALTGLSASTQQGNQLYNPSNPGAG